MGRSRYFQTPVIQGKGLSEPAHYLTYNLPLQYSGYPRIDLLGDSNYAEYTWEFGDRLDRIANKYYQDDQYWWVIALVNAISYPLGIKVGTVIRIPLDINEILQKLELV
jgi:hypothetical protein